jgi:hypothetical protein
MSTGIEDVFLSTAIQLIQLSQDSLCSSLRIYDSSDPMSPISNDGKDSLLERGVQNQYSVQETSLAHAESERTPMCC